MQKIDPKSASQLLKLHLSRIKAAEGAPRNSDPDDLRWLARAERPSVQFGSTTTETADWIPADTYAQTVFMGMHAQRVLGALAGAVNVDVEKGRGDTVQVRLFPSRTAQGPISEGSSLSDTAMGALTTKSIQILAYGDYDSITGRSIDFTSDDFKARLLTEMGAAVAEKLEQVCYDVLKNASSTETYTLAVSGVVEYEDILKAEAEFNKGYHPDFLIIGKTHKPDLLLDPNLTKVVDYGAGTVALPGEIGSIGSIRVLVHDLANAKSTTAGAVNAIMIDSSRAFGEAFGRPLSFEEQRVPESDKWKQVCWVFYGAAVLDASAICLLKNAA